LVDLGLKVHVEQAVGFVQDEALEGAQGEALNDDAKEEEVAWC
jgi:hypothetical protein